jgi:pimeloyl-ACP methyl ester carboxylesterase
MLENLSTMKGMNKEYLISEHIQKIDIKTFMLWGDCDSLNTAEEGMEICKNNSNIKLVKVENAGHAPCLDQRD